MTSRIRARIAAASTPLICAALICAALMPSAHADTLTPGAGHSKALEQGGNPHQLTRSPGTRPSSPTFVKRIKRTVYFAPLSSQLDRESQAVLARAARLVPASATDVTVRSIGYVQPNAFHGNDVSLSTQRARTVAAALRHLRVHGDYSVDGRGQAEQSGARGRRAQIIISFSLD